MLPQLFDIRYEIPGSIFPAIPNGVLNARNRADRK